MNMEFEKTINSLRGISSILIAMSEIDGILKWNEYAFLLLSNELDECIQKLDDILTQKGA